MGDPTLREWIALWLGLALDEHLHGMPLVWCALMVVVGVFVSLGTWALCTALREMLHALTAPSDGAPR